MTTLALLVLLAQAGAGASLVAADPGWCSVLVASPGEAAGDAEDATAECQRRAAAREMAVGHVMRPGLLVELDDDGGAVVFARVDEMGLAADPQAPAWAFDGATAAQLPAELVSEIAAMARSEARDDRRPDPFDETKPNPFAGGPLLWW